MHPFFVLKSKLYHPNNAQLGIAIMRTGVIHWHAGQIEEGHGLICKAYRILLVTHGPNHAITRDLEVCHTELPKTLMFCSSMSQMETARGTFAAKP